MYLDIITIKIGAVGEIPAQDDDHDSDIDGLESNNCNARRLVHKDGPGMLGNPIGKQHL